MRYGKEFQDCSLGLLVLSVVLRMFMSGSACVIGEREISNGLEGQGCFVAGKDDKSRSGLVCGAVVTLSVGAFKTSACVSG